ncbi:uncharacterized protein LOC126838675 isoform X2 [Adelges cooleyi]|nr:uncharacterized protein LOC126838675 isoform X2 [Adelges cooleyi]
MSNTVDGASMVYINPNLDQLTDKEWKTIFNEYDSDRDGFISSTELQKLVFDKFKGFVTVHQAELYIYLINNKNNPMCYEKFKQQNPKLLSKSKLKDMKPIIFVLSQRHSEEEIDKLLPNYQIFREAFVDIIWNSFNKLFQHKEEILEVLKTIGHNESLPIESTEYRKILKMLAATARMANIYKNFLSTNGKEDFFEYLSKSPLFGDPSGTLITKENTTLSNKFKALFIR